MGAPRRAGLRGADLTRACLRGADLRGADLWGADLTEANLTRADLTGANLFKVIWGVKGLSEEQRRLIMEGLQASWE
ncbi:hypothetical protein CMI37_29185 [Candidatus Pacearchaeota archaeon]|nr:hypothetical protein [Candidatus Pacearchaeota archaeon]